MVSSDRIVANDTSVNDLVVAHADLVKRIAYRIVRKLPPQIEIDDLVQAGMIGLIGAARNYSPSKGANFETYAGIRIRGAMLDEARKSIRTPQATARQAKQIAETCREIENRTGREPSGAEIADVLGMTLDDYYRVLEKAASRTLFSFEQLQSDPERAALLPEATKGRPDGALEDHQFKDALASAIVRLPRREQLVLSLYYDRDMNLREIGEVLGVSESRVCQIHGQAVERLRARLKSWERGRDDVPGLVERTP